MPIDREYSSVVQVQRMENATVHCLPFLVTRPLWIFQNELNKIFSQFSKIQGYTFTLRVDSASSKVGTRLCMGAIDVKFT